MYTKFRMCFIIFDSINLHIIWTDRFFNIEQVVSRDSRNWKSFSLLYIECLTLKRLLRLNSAGHAPARAKCLPVSDSKPHPLQIGLLTITILLGHRFMCKALFDSGWEGIHADSPLQNLNFRWISGWTNELKNKFHCILIWKRRDSTKHNAAFGLVAVILILKF